MILQHKSIENQGKVIFNGEELMQALLAEKDDYMLNVNVLLMIYYRNVLKIRKKLIASCW